MRKGLPEAIAREAGGKIFTFGSYRLGVHSAGADLDTLCVVPKHVDRDLFFDEMPQILSARSEVQEISVPFFSLTFRLWQMRMCQLLS